VTAAVPLSATTVELSVPVPVPVAALAELAKASPPTPPAMVNIATEATIAFRLGIMMSSFCSVELADRDRCDT